MSTSYLINTLKDKIGEKVNSKHRTMESVPTFIQSKTNIPLTNLIREHQSADQNDARAQFLLEFYKLLNLRSQKVLDHISFQTFQSHQAINQEITIMKQQLDTSGGVKELLNNLEDRERTISKQLQIKTSIFTDLRRIVCNQLQKQDIEIQTLRRQNHDYQFKESLMNQKMQKLEQELSQQQKDQSDLITLLNTLRQQQQIFKHDENQETHKYPYLSQAQQQSYTSIKSEEDDSLHFGTPPTKSNSYFEEANPQLMVSKPFKKGISLNLQPIKNGNQEPVGYHEEFMANINEFSESWRQQALAERRF